MRRGLSHMKQDRGRVMTRGDAICRPSVPFIFLVYQCSQAIAVQRTKVKHTWILILVLAVILGITLVLLNSLISKLIIYEKHNTF